MNKLFLLAIIISINSIHTFGQSWPLIIGDECVDESAALAQYNDSTYIIIRTEDCGDQSKYYISHFNLNGEVLSDEEIIVDPQYMLKGFFSIIQDDLGNYYAYGKCEDTYNFNENQTYVLKYNSDFEYIQSYVAGRPDISEYVRDLYFVNNTFFLAGFSENTIDDFLYKLNTDFEITEELLIDTVTGFGPSKLSMDFDGNELIMFMYTKKAYYIDTAAMLINSTHVIEDVIAISLREVLPLPESERYVLPFLNQLGTEGDTYTDLIIQFRDKNLSLLNESFITIDTMGIIQAKNTLNNYEDNIWLSYSTYREAIAIFYEEINHPIGVMKFNSDGDILYEGYIDGGANFVVYATLALQDGGALILTTRYDWNTPENKRDIYIFRVDADGDLILDVDDSPIQQFDFLVYPNPVSDYLIIKSQLIQFAFVEIYNMNGQLVNRNEKLSTELKIDLSQLSAGIYTYRIFTDKGVMQTGKFVKN
ncbi:MAG: T9SS type A sorting domain-containing protein [Bacteroidetes bacterium]|nr:T9SS type A sorting domain-containing protein [Bacteroidota bacterium]